MSAIQQIAARPHTSAKPPYVEQTVPFYYPFNSPHKGAIQKYLDVFELYKMIGNGTFKNETLFIQNKHEKGILENFKTIDKKVYQDDKGKLFPYTTFSISNRFDKQAAVCERINLDIDNNTKQELNTFLETIKTQKIPYIEAAFLSVGGKFNGSFSCNVKREMPIQTFDRKGKVTGDNIPKELKKALAIKSDEDWRTTQDKIHKAYHSLLSYFFKKDLGINVGTSKDLNRVRYLNHDPDIYINPDAKELRLFDLLNKEFLDYLEKLKNKNKDIAAFERLTVNIKETEWTKFCTAYSNIKGYTLETGKHLFLTHFSIAANLLGIHQNDVSTYVSETLGIDVRSNCITLPYSKYQESFGTWKYKLEAQKLKSLITEIKGKEGDKLTDLILPKYDIRGAYLVAPTGSGKTFLINELEGKKIIACPAKFLVGNVVGTYGAARYDSEQKDKLKGRNFIATTYDSTLKVSEIINPSEYDLWIDEGHNLVTASAKHFRYAALKRLLDIASKFKSVTIMTGTRLYSKHPFINAMPIINVSIPRPNKGLEIVEAKDNIKAAADKFKRSIQSGNFPIILFNNIKEYGGLGDLKVLINDKYVLYFNSKQKASKYFNEVIKTGNIPEHIKGMVVTTVLKEGNNILNEYDFDIIILGNFHSSEIEQMSNRPRNPKSVTISLIKKEDRLKVERDFNPQQYGWGLEQRCKKRIHEAEAVDVKTDLDYYLQELEVKQLIQCLPIVYNESGKLEIDYLLFDNHVFEVQKMSENRNDKLMIENLAKYGIEILSDKNEVHETERTAEEKKYSREYLKKQKEVKLKEFAKELTELKLQNDPVDYCNNALNHHSKNLSSVQKIIVSRYIELEQYITHKEHICNLMDELKLSHAKYKKTMAKLKIQSLWHNESYMESNRQFAMTMRQIYSTFIEGEHLTIDDIKENIFRIFEMDKSFDFSYYSDKAKNTKALNLLRLFFDVARKRITTEDDSKAWVYIVRATELDSFYNNKLQIYGPTAQLQEDYILEVEKTIVPF